MVTMTKDGQSYTIRDTAHISAFLNAGYVIVDKAVETVKDTKKK